MSRATRKQLHPIFVVLSFALPLIMQGVFLYYQIKNDILSFWSLIASIVMLLIVIAFARLIKLFMSEAGVYRINFPHHKRTTNKKQ